MRVAEWREFDQKIQFSKEASISPSKERNGAQLPHNEQRLRLQPFPGLAVVGEAAGALELAVQGCWRFNIMSEANNYFNVAER